MDIGTIILVVGIFLVLFILPFIALSFSRSNRRRGDSGTDAYRRGFMIGSLMEETHRNQGAEQHHHRHVNNSSFGNSLGGNMSGGHHHTNNSSFGGSMGGSMGGGHHH